MDDDVQTDDGILQNAKNTCKQDIDVALDHILKNDQSFIKLKISNVEVKSRCARDKFYGRHGNYKNEFKVGFGFSSQMNTDYQYLSKEFEH